MILWVKDPAGGGLKNFSSAANAGALSTRAGTGWFDGASAGMLGAVSVLNFEESLAFSIGMVAVLTWNPSIWEATLSIPKSISLNLSLKAPDPDLIPKDAKVIVCKSSILSI